MLVFPQNSPELRSYSGYLGAIDGIGMESMFFAPTDKPCDMDWCPTNLNEARAVKAAGKTVLAIDYAVTPANIASACAKYKTYGFAGYVTTLEVNRISSSCS
jgi:cysteinyl-tRNA synthetase